MEQPSVQPTTVRPYPSSVPPGVEDVFVWLTETPAPSDIFVGSVLYKRSYLLTVGGVAQWLERRSLTGKLSLIYA